MLQNLTLFLILLLICALPATGQQPHRKLPGPAAPMSATVPSAIQVGSLTLRHCGPEPRYCGSIPRALDPSGVVPGTLAIHFEFYPHSDVTQPMLETIVAVEGGPGYATTGSRDGYLGLFAPLRDRRDMLLVNLRGTGNSGALDCPALQAESTALPTGVRACGAQLGDTAYFYGSGLAADDVAAVLDALAIPLIDLYGDSYGTFFSQTFAGRHPDRLRALVLDSAYPPVGQSPWYPEIAPTAHFAFNAACRRSATCRDLPGTSMQRISQLAEALRTQPFTGWARDGNGVLHQTRADATNLDYLVVSNGTTSVVYRELDAAARAYLEQGNSAPLMRLLAENRIVSASGPAQPADYSEALFLAVSCSDYPQIYDMTVAPGARRLQRNRSVRSEEQTHPKVYEPFTVPEFAAMPLDTSVLNLCLDWPAPAVAPYPPGQPVPPHAQFTDAPVLVLSGDLDSLTPALQGKHSAGLFSHGRQVIVQNSFHVTAVGDEDNCASILVQRFVRELDPGDTSCAQHIAEVHLVPRFAAQAADLDPASPLPGNAGTDHDLRVAAAAVYTIGDTSGSGVGLRGGTFQYTSPSNLTYFTLNQLQWVEDVVVSGKMTWDYNYPGSVTADVTLAGPGEESGQLFVTWDSRIPDARTTLTGNIGGRKIAAQMYAP